MYSKIPFLGRLQNDVAPVHRMQEHDLTYIQVLGHSCPACAGTVSLYDC